MDLGKVSLLKLTWLLACGRVVASGGAKLSYLGLRSNTGGLVRGGLGML